MLIPIVVIAGFSMHAQSNTLFLNAATISQLLDECPLHIPDPVSLERVPTLNSMGYVFYIISPLGYQFIMNEASENKSILEIGAGFSNIAREALKHGAASYVANDLDLEHLKILVARIKDHCGNQAPLMLQRLSLLQAKAPRELPLVEDTFDAILLDKVLHFMTPSDIEYFIAWSKKALKAHGKLYILTISPFIKSFKDRLLPDYMAKRLQGNVYPGYVENIHDYINPQDLANHPQYKIPQMLTFFCRQDLENVFLQKGFNIQESYSVTLPTTSQGQWEIVDDNQGDLVALIAMKA